MQRRSWLFVFVTVAGFGILAARAQNLDEGKTAQQLFAADCVACHKGPQGLGKNASVGFLRQHYTSSTRSAELLAAYLAAAGAGNPRADRQKAAKGDEKEARAPKEPKYQKEARSKHKARDKTAAAKSSDSAPHADRKGRKGKRPITPGTEPAANTASPPPSTTTKPADEATTSGPPPAGAPPSGEAAAASPPAAAPSAPKAPDTAATAPTPPATDTVTTAAATPPPPPAPPPQPVFETPLP